MLAERDLSQRVGPVLSDGTTVRELIDFDRREISLRVLHDQELHRIELKKIFVRSWVPLAHTSEIPEAGDFVLRAIGEEPVIVTRDRDGEINVLLNVCAHRGMEVCRGEVGNTDLFKCPYHGWAYDNTGRLAGAPYEQEMYGDWDKSEYGLLRAHVELRHGIIFGNFAETPPPLAEWLGDYGWYFDRMFGGADWEPVGPPARNIINANWKVYADQLAGDLYHVATAHRSMVEIGFFPDPTGQLYGIKAAFPEGHSVISLNPPPGVEVPASDDPFSGRTFITLAFPGSRASGGDGMNIPGVEGRTANLGGFDPLGPGRLDSWDLWLVEKGGPESQKEALRKVSFTGGLVGADDATCWASMTQSASRGVLAGERTMKYNARSAGLDKPDGWPGPGDIYSGFSKDDTHWDFWQRWFDMLTADEA
jgi:nitrite reductase/ring-hydroxylating ferredoxin subunit